MSSQTFLWGSLILPWLSVFFLSKEDLRRYMPVALFSVLVTTIITEVGTTLALWRPTETIFPLVSMPPFTYGAYLVGTIWIFKYTYGKFWIYLSTNIVIDLFLTFVIANWMEQLGIFELYITPATRFLITIAMAIILYGYQMWQAGDVNTEMVPNVQPVAAKPLVKNSNDESDDDRG